MSAGAAAEAFIDSFRWADSERARFFVMERTQTDQIRTAFAERNVVADNFFNLRRSVNLIYGLAGNQGMYTLQGTMDNGQKIKDKGQWIN